jgi:hypothetical protein
MRSGDSAGAKKNGRKRKRKRAVDYSSSSSSDSSRGSYGDNGEGEENADKKDEDNQGEEDDEEGEEGEEAVVYRGVSMLRGKWHVTVCHNSRRVHLKGAFVSTREAAVAHDMMARCLLGAGAITNVLLSGDLNESRLMKRTGGLTPINRQEEK